MLQNYSTFNPVFKCKESEEELFYVFKNIFSAVQKFYTIQITQKDSPLTFIFMPSA